MAGLCLVAGLAIGYLSRAAQSPVVAAQRPAVAAAPHAAVAAGPRHLPTLEEMKQMADQQAAPLLARLKDDPKNSSLLVEIGALYHGDHQFSEAAKYYGKAAEADPKNVATRTKLAASLYRSGDVDGAIAQLKRGLSDDPKNADALFDLGMIKLQGKQDGNGAVAAWQKLLKTNPDLSADRKATVQKLMADVLTTMGYQSQRHGAESNDGQKPSAN
jgi:cytochrome c-type biogenesis protein CcmH/NrfG